MGRILLKDVLGRIDDYDEFLVIYVPTDQPIGPDSVVELVDYQGPQTQKPPGMRHLLSVEDTRVVLETWSNWRNGSVPSDQERCEAIAYYAKHDGYIPVA